MLIFNWLWPVVYILHRFQTERLIMIPCILHAFLSSKETCDAVGCNDVAEVRKHIFTTHTRAVDCKQTAFKDEIEPKRKIRYLAFVWWNVRRGTFGRKVDYDNKNLMISLLCGSILFASCALKTNTVYTTTVNVTISELKEASVMF